MKAETQILPAGDEWAMPWDLTERSSAAELRQWIQEEVETLDWTNPEVIAHLRQHPAYQPRMLLCLLTFAYATGVYESEGIILRCEQDENFRSICGRQAPASAKFLIRFRRENRGLLKWCLVQLFKRVIKAELDDPLLPAGLKRRLIDAAVGRLDMARQVDRGSEEL